MQFSRRTFRKRDNRFLIGRIEGQVLCLLRVGGQVVKFFGRMRLPELTLHIGELSVVKHLFPDRRCGRLHLVIKILAAWKVHHKVSNVNVFCVTRAARKIGSFIPSARGTQTGIGVRLSCSNP